MTKSLYLTSADSDLTGGTLFNKYLRSTVETSSEYSSNLGNGQTATSFGYTEAGYPGAIGAITGNYTVRVVVSTGSTDIFLSVAVARVNSTGTQQAISSFTAEQQATAGTKSFTTGLTNINLGTWVAGDRLRVSYRARNAAAHATRSYGVTVGTTDAEVVAPWTDAINASGGSTAQVEVTSEGSGENDLPEPNNPVIEQFIKTTYLAGDNGGPGGDITFPSMTPQQGELLLAIFCIKDFDDYVIDANDAFGLTNWQRLVRHDDLQETNKIDVWYAYVGSTPSTDAAHFTPGEDVGGYDPNINLVAYLLRISNVNEQDIFGIVDSEDTGATDTNSPSLTFTTEGDDSLVVWAATYRDASLTPTSGWTQHDLNTYVATGGSTASGAIFSGVVADPSQHTVGGTLSTVDDWIVIGIEINSGSAVQEESGGSTAEVTAEGEGAGLEDPQWGETTSFTGITDLDYLDTTVTPNTYRYKVAVADNGVAITEYTPWVAIEVEPTGGSQDEVGGSTAQVTVDGEAAATIDIESGSTAEVEVTGEGSGTLDIEAGSTHEVEVTSDGVGSAVLEAEGGATAQVDITSEGAGTGEVQAANGSTAQVTIDSEGAGTHNISGSSTSEVEVTSEGAGTFNVIGESTAQVEVTSEGQGSDGQAIDATGSSTATVNVSGEGQGAAEVAAEGASTAEVAVVPEGSGTAAVAAAGGSTAGITASGEGQGLAAYHVVGGSTAEVAVTSEAQATVDFASDSTADVTITSEGSGTDGQVLDAQGGSTATVDITGEGSGEALLIASGASESQVDVTSEGAGTGQLEAVGNRTALVEVDTEGAGAINYAGAATADIEVIASGSGFDIDPSLSYVDITVEFSAPVGNVVQVDGPYTTFEVGEEYNTLNAQVSNANSTSVNVSYVVNVGVDSPTNRMTVVILDTSFIVDDASVPVSIDAPYNGLVQVAIPYNVFTLVGPNSRLEMQIANANSTVVNTGYIVTVEASGPDDRIDVNDPYLGVEITEPVGV